MNNEEAAQHVYTILRNHQPTSGMAVAMGTTCRCGEFCPGGRGKSLLDHQATLIVADLLGDE